MFRRALPDVLPLPDMLGEQLGGEFSDMVSDDGGYDWRDEHFEQLRLDGRSFGSMSDADLELPEKSFLEFTDLVWFAVASVASWRAAL